MKRVITSLSLVAVATAVVILGGTGAWWTDEATSHNTSFKSGNMDLKLKGYDDNGYGNYEWRDTVGQTWDYENMSPGGEPDGGALKLKNAGTTKADWLKFATTTDPQPAIMNEAMRITKLDYAGENLLKDGAGADLSKYEAPENCDVNLNSLNSKLSNYDVEAGDVVCVEAGDYYGNFSIDIEDITLASKEGVSNTSVNGTINIISDGVIVRGFNVTQENPENNEAQAPIQVKNSSDVLVEYNKLAIESDVTDGDDFSIKGVYLHGGEGDTTNENLRVENNQIVKVAAEGDPTGDYETGYMGATGVMIQGNLKNVAVEKNTIEGIYSAGWSYGVEVTYTGNHAKVPKGVIIQNNIIEEVTAAKYDGYSLSIEATDSSLADPREVTVKYNNFEKSSDKLIINKNGNHSLNAQYNWWGRATGSKDEEVKGIVNTDNYLGNSHVGFVNGNDQNGNGFADLEDLHFEDVVVEEPKLDEGVQELDLEVQMDGPTSTNDHQGGTVGIDMEINMGQGPVQ